MKHTAIWQTPHPLWRDRLETRDHTGFRRPDILRFTGDDFMEAVEGVLRDDIETLKDYVVTHEQLDDAEGPVRLYLPAHLRYYLLSASLVCRTRGMPDRKVDRNAGESVSFVIRRVSNGDEQGWFGDHGWRTLPDPDAVDGVADVGKEERLPLFWIPFEDDRYGVTRKLALGFVPVGNREKYEAGISTGSASLDGVAIEEADDPRLSQFTQTVRLALKGLRDAIDSNLATDDAARDSYTIAMLDIGEFFNAYFPLIFEWLLDPTTELSPDDEAVTDWMGDIQPLVKEVWEARDEIMGLGGAQDPTLSIDSMPLDDIKDQINDLDDDADDDPENPDFFEQVRQRIEQEGDMEDVVGASTVPTVASGSTYVARCVYERPKCAPYKGPVVSEPTRQFQFATFYDANLPMRPIRVTMPIDTSVRGLRKAGKSFQIQMSNTLREQVERFAGADIADIKNSEKGEKSFDLGVICSFSIPIITICALILLMLIVALLNFVFFWIPLLRICLPLRLSSND